MEDFKNAIVRDNVLHTSMYEMLCDADGFINKSFFEHFYDLSTVSSSTFLKNLKEQIGYTKFVPEYAPDNTVDREMFFEQYEFAKYPRTLQWIHHFALRGETLTKEALFAYLVSDSKPKLNISYGGDFE